MQLSQTVSLLISFAIPNVWLHSSTPHQHLAFSPSCSQSAYSSVVTAPACRWHLRRHFPEAALNLQPGGQQEDEQ